MLHLSLRMRDSCGCHPRIGETCTLDVFADEQPALASCYGASLSDRQLLGASPGAQTRKLVHPVRELRSSDEALAEAGGVNVHVGSAILPELGLDVSGSSGCVAM